MRQRVRIAQPGMTVSAITPATKSSIKRSKSEAGFPARWSASGRNGGVGFSLNSRRACLLQTLRAIFVASWDDRSVRPQDSAPHTRRGCGRGFSVDCRLVCVNERACDGRSSDRILGPSGCLPPILARRAGSDEIQDQLCGCLVTATLTQRGAVGFGVLLVTVITEHAVDRLPDRLWCQLFWHGLGHANFFRRRMLKACSICWGTTITGTPK